MDIHQLCSVLQGCLSESSDIRCQAEAVLQQHECAQGQVVNLLRVAAEGTVDLGVRQVAAISFKNIAKRNWEGADGKPALLQEADKQIVRDNILEALIRAPHAVQVQLGEVFRSIVYCDYPASWPGLLQDITTNLVHMEHARVYGALYAIRILARKYEFRDEEERAPLEAIVNATFPLLLQIFKTLLATPSPSTQVADYIKLVCKTFWSANFMGVPTLLLQQEQFSGWMTCLHDALRQQLPLAEMPADEREKWPWFKARKWVLHITYRLFNRYGDPQKADPGNDQEFSNLFVAHCSTQFLEDHLALMTQLSEGQYMSPRVINLALQYLTHAVDLKPTYKLLKPHIEPLLQQVVFPLMCFTEEDADLWEEDPAEYIRKGYDILEDMYSTKTAAVNFAHTLCSKKPKAHLERFMALLVHVLNEYMAVHKAGGPASVPSELARRMDGALLAVGTLHDVLKRKAPYKGQLGAMLVQHVIPCYESVHGHLRAKACWVSGVFSDTQFASGKGSGAEYGALFTRVIQALHDKELPVRVDAVVALRSFVEELEDIEQLKPILPQLLSSIFALMNEVDNEDLVYTLEAIVEKFGDDIAPYALELAHNLVAAFWKYSKANEEDEDDDDETAAIAAYGCLKAINTLLDAVSNLRHLFGPLEEACFPIMQRMISTEGQDVFEDVLELLVYFTYFSESISPRLWSLWPQIHAALEEFAVDYWENILLPLDNFVHRDTATFLAGAAFNYQESVFKMVQHSLTGDFHETDIVCAPRLLSVVLQCCRGAVDHWVEPYVRLALTRLPTAEKRQLKDDLLLVVANALYYNAELTLGVLSRMGVVQQLFMGWFTMIFERRPKGTKPAHFRQQQDKKVCVLGLASILAVPDAAMPPEVANGLPQLLAGIMKLLLDLKAQQDEVEERANEDDEEDEDEEADDEEAEIDLGEEDDEAPGNEQDDEYMKKLKRAAKDILNGGDNDEDDDDDDDAVWSDDDDTVQSPLDPIDPFIMFAETLTAMQTAMPARYAATVSSADAGVQAALQSMIMHAAAQREKLQEEQLQQQQQQQQQQQGAGA